VRKIHHSKRRPLRLGYVALSDCAPLAMARSLGLFEKYSLPVELSREVGWATIRDKVISGELDAAHAPAGMLVGMHCGIRSVQAPCLTGLVLNLNGNAITLSETLWKKRVRDGASLRAHLTATRERLTFGIVYQHSSHAFLLRHWLRSHGIDPDRDVQLVIVPPAQVYGNLKAGHLDGYCVGEPWNSLAVMSRIGWVPATSAELEPRHPEKVLLIHRDFAEAHEAEHLALIAALIEACRFCDQPANRDRLLETLAEFISAPIHAVEMSMRGTFDYGHGRIEKTGPQHIFHEGNANDPSADKAAWVIGHFLDPSAITDPSLIPPETAARCFRSDLFHQALALTKK